MHWQIRFIGPTLTALLLGIGGCPGEPETGHDGGNDCPASQQSGLWLNPFGPVAQEIHTEGKAKLTAILMHGSDQQEIIPASGQTVTFKIITPGGDAKLEASTVTTDQDGLASTSLQAGSVELAHPYQVEASAPGTCPVTFSIEVRKPLLQLRAVTPSPYDTFTNSRIPITVEATTNGFARLSDREITFSFKMGKTTETTLSAVSDTGSGSDTLKLKTDGGGRATAMLLTGSQPIPQLTVEAAMEGTAPAQVVVRIAKGKGSGCKDDWDCPLGYTCKNGACEPPPVTPPTGCTSDADCPGPTICQTSTGKCLQPTGKPCDPIEGTGCAADEVCIGKQCAKIPSGCVDNSACPSTFYCDNGVCKPGGQQPGGCITNKDCPAANVCINGACKPKTACNIAHAPDRLKGNWRFNSTLHLRDSLSGFLKGILSTAGILRDIIEGRFKVSGIPSFISKLVEKYLKKLINQYVPPWGQQLIVALGDINDVVDDMLVISTVNVAPAGPDLYSHAEVWDLVEFEYKGQKIAAPPHAIPQIGLVKIPLYSSSEVCGVWFIEKHEVNNVVGGIIKWAIDTALSIVTCNTPNTPCFQSIDQALQMSINCQMLGFQLDQIIMSIWSGAPSVAMIVIQACNAQKGKLIQTLSNELNGLTTKLSLLELSGTVDIPNPPMDKIVNNGKWYGVLGSGSIKGNFKGEFKANKF